MKSTVLLDFGNTLVEYYTRAQFPGILESGITQVEDYLRREGLLTVPPDVVRQRVQVETREAQDCVVRPMEGRLSRIFGLDGLSDRHMSEMCRCFLAPTFALAKRYDDVLPVLRALRAGGIRTAIVSNLPWGSPGDLWREEIVRLGLSTEVDEVVLCRDVGWRKPAREIFEHTLRKMQADPADCLFVGDDLRWDIAGPRAVGIDAILIDRNGSAEDSSEVTITSLYELPDRLAGFGR